MSLSNVNMPCILLFRIVIFVLVYCGAPSPTQHASDTSFVPPRTHEVTSPSITSASRDAASLIVTQCLGHCTRTLHYALNLSYHDQTSQVEKLVAGQYRTSSFQSRAMARCPVSGFVGGCLGLFCPSRMNVVVLTGLLAFGGNELVALLLVSSAAARLLRT